MHTLTWPRFRYNSLQFGIWRAAFGLMMAFHFIWLWPYGKELYSDRGPFANLDIFSSHHTFFPSFLLEFDSVIQIQAMLALCIVLSLLIMVGCARQPAALLLWLIQAWFHNRNNFNHPPEIGFINWLIFALIFIPAGERFALAKKCDNQWSMPPSFYWGGWVVLAIGYFFAGYHKVTSPDHGWMEGSAMYYVMTRSYQRWSWYGDFFELLPMWIFRLWTWAALLLETIPFPFIMWQRLRFFWWLAATGTHFFLLFFLNLTEVHLGMIIFQCFLFDLLWLENFKWRPIAAISQLCRFSGDCFRRCQTDK